MDGAIAGARLELGEAEKEKDEREQAQKSRDSEELKLSGLKAKLGTCDKNIGTQGNKTQSMELEAGKLQVKIDGLRRQLAYANRAAADRAKEGKQRESNAL